MGRDALFLSLTRRASSAPGSGTVLVAGGFAGIASWAVATPLDVIKSRMQMARLKQREYRGGAGLRGKQRPAGKTGGLLPGAHHQQCPRLSRQRRHLPQLRIPPAFLRVSLARQCPQLPSGGPAQ